MVKPTFKSRFVERKKYYKRGKTKPFFLGLKRSGRKFYSRPSKFLKYGARFRQVPAAAYSGHFRKLKRKLYRSCLSVAGGRFLLRRGVIKVLARGRFSAFARAFGPIRRGPPLVVRRASALVRRVVRRQTSQIKKAKYWLKLDRQKKRGKRMAWRPFWKRKRYRRLREEQKFLRNQFMYVKGQFFHERNWFSRLHKVVEWRNFVRANAIRHFFKNRIFLRHFWRSRYRYYTHRKLKTFLLTTKRHPQRLLRFMLKYELVLSRYVRLWGLIPVYSNDTIARVLVSNGFIYVNFKAEINPDYMVKTGDCIFCYLATKVMPRFFFTANDFYNYGTIKDHSGRKPFGKLRYYIAPFNTTTVKPWRRYKKRRVRWNSYTHTHKGSLFMLKFLSVINLSTWSADVAMFYTTFLEVSYKIKMVVPIVDYDWFLLSFAGTGDFRTINPTFVNKFINFSYY